MHTNRSYNLLHHIHILNTPHRQGGPKCIQGGPFGIWVLRSPKVFIYYCSPGQCAQQHVSRFLNFKNFMHKIFQKRPCQTLKKPFLAHCVPKFNFFQKIKTIKPCRSKMTTFNPNTQNPPQNTISEKWWKKKKKNSM